MSAFGHAHAPSCRWFWAWAVVGAALALSAVSLGVLALAPAALVGAVLWSRPTARGSAFGLLSGMGVLLAYIAWVQRAGPLDPLPWAIAGLVLFCGGLVGHARRM
jgi:hypothetical protein